MEKNLRQNLGGLKTAEPPCLIVVLLCEIERCAESRASEWDKGQAVSIQLTSPLTSLNKDLCYKIKLKIFEQIRTKMMWCSQTRIWLATFVICSAASVTKLSLLYVYLGFLKNSQHFYTIKDLNIFDFWATYKILKWEARKT